MDMPYASGIAINEVNTKSTKNQQKINIGNNKTQED